MKFLKINKNRRKQIEKAGILLILLFAFRALHAQITINQTDMPSPGDTIRTSTGLNLDFVDITATGENYNWDFSQLIPISQAVDTFVGPLQTPIFYWPFFLLSSNLASPIIGDLPIPNIPVSDVYTFYNNNSSNFHEVGSAATWAGIPLPFKFDTPDILYVFPMNYGDVDSSESGYEFGIPDLGYLLVDRKRVNHVDGWGTLVTPFGTFDVLRQKSEVYEYDSLFIDSLGIGVPVTRSYTEYKWLAKGMKIPVLQVDDNIGGLVAVYIDSLVGEPVGVHSRIKTSGLEVFPNPVLGQLFVQFSTKKSELVKISLYTLQGKRILDLAAERFSPGNHQSKINLSEANLESGNYLLEVVVGENVINKKIIYIKN